MCVFRWLYKTSSIIFRNRKKQLFLLNSYCCPQFLSIIYDVCIFIIFFSCCLAVVLTLILLAICKEVYVSVRGVWLYVCWSCVGIFSPVIIFNLFVLFCTIECFPSHGNRVLFHSSLLYFILFSLCIVSFGCCWCDLTLRGYRVYGGI